MRVCRPLHTKKRLKKGKRGGTTRTCAYDGCLPLYTCGSQRCGSRFRGPSPQPSRLFFFLCFLFVSVCAVTCSNVPPRVTCPAACTERRHHCLEAPAHPPPADFIYMHHCMSTRVHIYTSVFRASSHSLSCTAFLTLPSILFSSSRLCFSFPLPLPRLSARVSRSPRSLALHFPPSPSSPLSFLAPIHTISGGDVVVSLLSPAFIFPGRLPPSLPVGVSVLCASYCFSPRLSFFSLAAASHLASVRVPSLLDLCAVRHSYRCHSLLRVRCRCAWRG